VPSDMTSGGGRRADGRHRRRGGEDGNGKRRPRRFGGWSRPARDLSTGFHRRTDGGRYPLRWIAIKLMNARRTSPGPREAPGRR
jgi:hypothetical protein